MEDPATAVAVNEDAKWTFTALTHAHVPVDPLDETTVEKEDISRYKVIYAVGSTIARTAAEKLAAWVQQGGILYTSGYSLVFDEFHRPLTSLRQVLGLKERRAPELWQLVEVAGAVGLRPLETPSTNPPPARIIVPGTLSKEPCALAIGREVLTAATGTDVVARYGDGEPAVTVHEAGKGRVYVIGFFAGLEYAAPTMKPEYDLTKDFDATRRGFVVAPALQHVTPTVDAGVATVEGELLRNPTTGKQAVVLVNWTYRANASGAGPRYEHISLEDLNVIVRADGKVQQAISGDTGQKLTVRTVEDGIAITVPKLEDGDVLLLE